MAVWSQRLQTKSCCTHGKVTFLQKPLARLTNYMYRFSGNAEKMHF